MTKRKQALDEEPNGAPKRAVRSGETFGDVVLRLKGTTKPLTSFAGAWKSMPKEDLAKIRDAIRSGREHDRKRMGRLMKNAED